jgi:hypothetical protein
MEYTATMEKFEYRLLMEVAQYDHKDFTIWFI